MQPIISTAYTLTISHLYFIHVLDLRYCSMDQKPLSVELQQTPPLLDTSIDNCPFCHSDVIERQCVLQSDYAMALYAASEAALGHLLVIPNRHVLRYEALQSEEIDDIHHLTTRLVHVIQNLYGAEDYAIIQKNGRLACQSVAHIHFHIIPCRIPFSEIIKKDYFDRNQINTEEMRIRTEEIRSFINLYPSSNHQFN